MIAAAPRAAVGDRLLVRHRQHVEARGLGGELRELAAEEAPGAGHDRRPLKSSYPNSRTTRRLSVVEFQIAIAGSAMPLNVFVLTIV